MSKNKKIKVIFKKPNEDAQVIEISDTLETYQELVDGYIEVVRSSLYPNVLVIVNEEGKLMGLEPNVDTFYDILVGNIVVLRDDFKGGFASIKDSEINAIVHTLNCGAI